MIVTDWDGGLLGYKGQIISRNKGIVQSYCVEKAEQNAYHCQGLTFGTLKFESTASDRRERVIIPVNLLNAEKNFNNTLDMGWEWHWKNGQPVDTRLIRYFGLILLNQTTFVEYPSTLPRSKRYALQVDNPVTEHNPRDWVILKTKYTEPMSIKVTYKNGT